MSAGHHNNTNPTNLCNVPFLLQAGEKDTAYGRHKATAQFAARLAGLRKEYPKGYAHDCWIHVNRGHGIVDRDPAGKPQAVIANVAKWLNDGDRAAVNRNTNAVAWLAQHKRNPWPERVVWDLRTRADRSGRRGDADDLWPTTHRGDLFYWLDITEADNDGAGGNLLEARIDRKANAVVVTKGLSGMRILLNQRMLDLAKPVVVKVGGHELKAQPKATLKALVETLVGRGDPFYMFEAGIGIEREGETWRLSGP
jgi:hypothetical protein